MPSLCTSAFQTPFILHSRPFPFPLPGGQHNGQGSSLALGHPHLPPSVSSAPPCPVQDRPRSRLTTTRGSLWLLGDEAGRFRIFTPELTGGRDENLPTALGPCSLTSLCLGTSVLGHFMGKKSLEAPSPSLLGTVPQISPRAQRLQRSHDLLGILRLKKAVGPGPGGPAPHTQVSLAPGPPPQAQESPSQAAPGSGTWLRGWLPRQAAMGPRSQGLQAPFVSQSSKGGYYEATSRGGSSLHPLPRLKAQPGISQSPAAGPPPTRAPVHMDSPRPSCPPVLCPVCACGLNGDPEAQRGKRQRRVSLHPRRSRPCPPCWVLFPVSPASGANRRVSQPQQSFLFCFVFSTSALLTIRAG